MLRIEHISLDFTNPILRDITFQVKPNEIIGIAGQSGAGKTSLLKIIAGLIDPNSGTVHLENKRIVGPSQKLVPGYEDIQLVNQDFNLDTYLTCEENIKSKILHLTKNLQAAFVDELLDLLELNHVRTNLAHTLSGGEQQRLAIARAIVNRPSILIADEPTANLDQENARLILDVFRDFNRVGVTTLIASHDRPLLQSYSNRTLLIEPGRFTDLGHH